MNLSDLGEQGLLELIRDWTGGASGRVLLGPGDDAALIDPPAGRELVVSTDAFVEGVHFSRAFLTPDEIGHRVMAGSLSDLAAMGAEGYAALVNLHAPPDTPVEFVRSVFLGMDRVADSCGVVIAGGDTVRGEFALGITVIGHVARGRAIRREGAKEDDVLCVSGELGRSETGRRLLAGEIEVPITLRSRRLAEAWFRQPRPRFDVSRLLVSLQRRTIDVDLEQEHTDLIPPTAMIDISDGLGIDLGRLCEASNVGCRLEERLVPVNSAAAELARRRQQPEIAAALSGGEDYELLFTMPPENVELLLGEAKAARITISPIGSITPAREGRILVRPDGETVPLRNTGWDHFCGAPPAGRDAPESGRG
jgi:thiamine-monophosphate kinase